MWKVKSPAWSTSEAYSLCISNIRDFGLHARLTQIEGDIVAAAAVYKTYAESKRLNEISTSNCVAGLVSKQEMSNLYDRKMATKGSPARSIYDKLKLLPQDDRCPFCFQRNVSTLDHILPKAWYPALAVCTLNLVGACMECNKAKLASAPSNVDEVVLHPYFDDVTLTQWLRAKVVPTAPCAVLFFIDKPPDWDQTTYLRATRQFKMLGLGLLYSIEAARELSNIRYNLQMHFDAGGQQAVRLELIRQWQSRQIVATNSWQTALYQALSADTWFCTGGFCIR